MPRTSPHYNERAWAIDVISEINAYCAPRARAVVRAGGEYSVTGQSGCLFPDVLLFGAHTGAVVQQGWELKMPDTAINDRQLLENAEQKARRLGLNSFLVWNVNEAALYAQTSSGAFTHKKTWPAIDITRRADVAQSRPSWVRLLHTIIDDVNDFLDRGDIAGARPEVAISDALFLDHLEHFTPSLAQAIKRAHQTDATFAAELNFWWAENKTEHPGCTEFEGLARVNIINWVNRILFAHYLKRFNNAANAVESIKSGTTINAAIRIFDTISASCDFLNVFKPALGQKHIDSSTWDGLIHLNCFLKDLNLGAVTQESFHKVIETALTYARKKLAGQFSTPRPLADLLVRLTIQDRTKPIVDPCCGTGTIARAAYDLKRTVGLTTTEALETTWASDKFAFPLQLCSIALSDPLGMGEVVQVFRHDAFTLASGQSIKFTDPSSGAEVSRNLPVMHAAVSNLPFVRFEDSEKLNPSLTAIKGSLTQNCAGGATLEGRADLYAYLVFKLRDLVEEHGRVGIISSNSWLAVEWGKQFREILARCFKIRQVVVSGEGRWFDNSDVVTTILILEKRSTPAASGERIEFIATTTRIGNWATAPGGVDQLANHILAPAAPAAGFTKQEYTQSQIQALEAVGIGWNALFADLSWISNTSPNLVPASRWFDFSRGERRGWDKLFYPKAGHGIEAEYIKPVLKSARNVSGLLANANGEAFCCSASISALQSGRKRGALAWISRFQNATNKSGKPLTESLARHGHKWYEMRPSTLADFAISINPDKRIGVYRLRQRAFVNQRLTPLVLKTGVTIDLDLCHALMNSTIGIFMIEAIGFGRGLGVLDLNATNLAEHLHMLNPMAASANQRQQILTAFAPLLRRDILDLTSELQSSDRLAFDKAVLQAFGISQLQNQIYNSLRQLFHIRQTART